MIRIQIGWLRGGSLALAVSIGIALPSGAQQRPREVRQQAIEAMQAVARARGFGEPDGLAAGREYSDGLGQTHVRFRQTYRGIPVWGGEAVAHVDAAGRMLAPTWHMQGGIRLDARPRLGVSQAQAAALRAEAAGMRITRAPRIELVVLPVTSRTEMRTLTKAPQPLNAIELHRRPAGHRLAYHVHLEMTGPAGIVHRDYLLDASTGAVLQKWDSLPRDAATGTGHSQYSGTVSLDTSSTPAGFELRDRTRGSGGRFGSNVVLDLAHSTSGDGAVYTSADDIWGDGNPYADGGDTGSANGQTAAVDAAYGLQRTWDFYRNVFGRQGIDGQGTATYARVHYSTWYMDAFWDDGCFCMTYGDGDHLNPFTALDITGHEMTHGVTSAAAGLILFDESGMLNEATSDIFGAMVEFYARGGSGSTIGNSGGNWTIGEQIVSPAMRFMYKPSLDNVSPDAWYDGIGNLDIHNGNGPMNRAFYFLSQGSSPDPASLTDSPYLTQGAMQGIGNDEAARIWYRALTVYLTMTSGYADAREAALRAAIDLYGAGSAEDVAVRRAFGAINVGDPYAAIDDFDPPTVALSETGNSGTVQFTAQATDNVGVAEVDLFVDGVPVGTRRLDGEPASATFEMDFDSTSVSNQSHLLTAIAYDRNRNAGYAEPVSFQPVNRRQQLLANPGFEAGFAGWGGTAWILQPDRFMPAPHSGAFLATLPQFWDDQGAHPSAACQPVSLPAETPFIVLSFWEQLQTGFPLEARDTLSVQLRTGSSCEAPDSPPLATLDTLTNLDSRNRWVRRSYDLSAFRGQTLLLYIEGAINDQRCQTSYWLDDIAITASLDQPVGIAVTPALPAAIVGQRIAFQAAVSGPGDRGVVWSLAEPRHGGAIDPATGVLTAPEIVGEYTVRATSVQDPGVSAEAPLRVIGPQGESVVSSPMSVSLGTLEKQDFTAYFSNAATALVHWATTPGSEDPREFANPATFTAQPVARGPMDPMEANTRHEGLYAWSTVRTSAIAGSHLVPAGVNLWPLTPQRFGASWTTGPVAWSVQEGDAGGVIDDTGLYTAPSTPGIYHVVGTDAASPGLTAMAEVAVTRSPRLQARIVSPGFESWVPSGTKVALVGAAASGLTGQTVDAAGEWWIYAPDGTRSILPGNVASLVAATDTALYADMYFMQLLVFHVTDAAGNETYAVCHLHVLPPGESGTIASLAVLPAGPALAGTGTRAFTAAVEGTGPYSRDVLWSASRGTITSAGLYTPPASGGTDTITATSVTDASLTVSLTISADIPPAAHSCCAAGRVIAPR